ncbi:hypothetical protein H8959_010249 [Pygathrix nigripes]
MRERQLKKAEKKLQDDALAFEEFLRENDQRSVDALKFTGNDKQTPNDSRAEESKHGELSLHSSKKEGILEESWGTAILSEDASQGRDSQGKPSRSLTRTSEKMESNLTESFSSEDSLEFLLDDEMDFDLVTRLYLLEPEELLQVLRELEEQNLTLFQYSQDVDENLEEVNKREKVIQDKTNSNIEFLLEQEEMLKANCMREEEKAAELQLRSRLFSFGEFNSDAQEGLPMAPGATSVLRVICRWIYGDAHLLERKQEMGQNTTWRVIHTAQQFVELLLIANTGFTMVKEDDNFLTVLRQVTYHLKNLHQQLKRHSVETHLVKRLLKYTKSALADAEDDGLNPIQKLVKVESRLVELCDLIESIPKENVEAIERMKQKERRQKFRDEKMKEKQRHQEERLKAALEKAVAQPKKKLGRRLVYHSKPPSANKRQLPLVNETKTKAQEEEYFFT